MLVDGLQDGFLTFQEGRGVRKVDALRGELLWGQEAILVFLVITLVVIIGHTHNKTFINLEKVSGEGIFQAVGRGIAI